MSRADSWDDSPTHPPPAAPRARKAEPVRDDWDDDASSADEEEDPHKLWEDANNRAPMPTVVIAGPAAASAPPVQALQPSMRILKRPSGPAAATSATPSPTSADMQRNLAEREAQYQAARQRIFGQSEGGTAGANTLQGASATPPRIATPQTATQAVPAAKVLRNPRGPDSVSPDASGGDVKATGPPRGFRRRGQQHPPRSTPGRGRSS